MSKLLVEFFEFVQTLRLSQFFYSEGKSKLLGLCKKIGFFLSYLKNVDNQRVQRFKLDLETYFF